MASIFGLSDKNSFQMTQNNSVLRISRESNFIVHTQHPSTECNFLPDRFFLFYPIPQLTSVCTSSGVFPVIF